MLGVLMAPRLFVLQRTVQSALLASHFPFLTTTNSFARQAMGQSERSNASADGTEEAKDATLGGYLNVHNRPPAFEGPDGHPYTVSIEVEKTANLMHPFGGFLVFPRWAQTGLGIVGHVETPVLWEGAALREVEEEAGLTPLPRVKELLDEAVLRSSPGPS